MDDIFPKLSSLLTNLAMESEQVAMKNRKVYIYSQSYKLQLSVLQVCITRYIYYITIVSGN